MAMTGASRTASLWAPPVILMGVIFGLSAISGDGRDHGLLYVLSRKAGHFAEYALLLALLWRALRESVPARSALGLAFAITVVYAATDEFHQRFVDGRHSSLRDVAIDALGAATAAALIVRRERTRSTELAGA